MRRIGFSLVLFSLVMSASLMAQKRHDGRWIKDLKKTPVDQLGSGLPRESFAGWFAGLVRPNQIGYAIEQCDLYNPQEGTTEKLFCVVAYTKPPQPGWGRWIQLSFIVGAEPSREGRTDYVFLRGIEAPTDPNMARPDHIISTLSDLERIVRDTTYPLMKSRRNVNDPYPCGPGFQEKLYDFSDDNQRNVSPPCAS